MKKSLLFAALFCCSTLFSACNPFGREKEAGVAIPAEEYKTYFASLKQNTAEEGKRVSYEGYIHIGSDITIQDIYGIGDNLAAVQVYSQPLGQGEHIQMLLASFGESNNTLAVPDEFSGEDIVINAHNGEKLAFDQKVKISGTITYPKKEGNINSSTKEREYDYFLTDIRFDKAQ